MMTESKDKAIQVLMQSRLLGHVPENVLRSLDPPPQVITLAAGRTLIRQGDENTGCFFLIKGQLRVFREEKNGRLTPLSTVFPGESVGEMSLITNEPRSATVIARLDSELVFLPQSTFLTIAAADPLTVINMARGLLRRLTHGPGPVKTHADHPVIAVASLSPEVGAMGIARTLGRELEKYGTCVVIDAGPDRSLDDFEQEFDFVVYACEPSFIDRTRTCILRADLVLFAVNAAAAAQPGKLEGELLPRLDRNILGNIHLLLVHPGDWLTTTAAAVWRERLRPNEHHHIRSSNADDMARVGRLIVGRAVNVVLSGGGARGLAHIGVLRAFRAFGIPVDRISGTSMGAIVAGLYAAGSFDERVHLLRELCLKRRPGSDFTLPFVSVISGRRMTNTLTDLCGEAKIEDLPIGYFCVSSDLGRAELVEHVDGLLWLALRASAAVPVLTPPMVKDGRVLVDGGVLNNCPIDIMRRRFSGSVVAVDVAKEEPLRVNQRWDMASPSGFQVLRSKLNPFARDIGFPGIIEMVLRTAMLASERQARQVRTQADLLIMPAGVEMYGVTEFEPFDEIVEKGYTHTMRLLEHDGALPEAIMRTANR